MTITGVSIVVSTFGTLKLYYQNVRGLQTKTSDIFDNVLYNNFDITIPTKPCFNSSILDAELFDNRYIVYRRDRETSGFKSVSGNF